MIRDQIFFSGDIHLAKYPSSMAALFSCQSSRYLIGGVESKGIDSELSVSLEPIRCARMSLHPTLARFAISTDNVIYTYVYR